jgi:hypothetical protein
MPGGHVVAGSNPAIPTNSNNSLTIARVNAYSGMPSEGLLAVIAKSIVESGHSVVA